MARVDPSKTVYVYGLHTESNKTIMYVGCSVSPEMRLRQHRSEAKLSARYGYRIRPFHAWILSCIEGGENVIFSILETCQAVDAPQSETKWINNTRLTNPSLLNEKQAPAYCSHLRTIADWLQPMRSAKPGDTVFQVKKSYLTGRDTDEIVAVQIVKLSDYSRVCIGGLINGLYKERWVSKSQLYQPKEPPQQS